MGLSKPCILLIVIAGMERFSFKGVAANLVTYLTEVAKMSNSSAAKTVNSWVGFTSIMPILVAPLADSYWDSYATILVFSFLYLLGLMALTSTTLIWSLMTTATSTAFFALFSSLYLISIGLGGLNPSLQAFGADQLEPEDNLPVKKDEPVKSNQRTLFFQWWYFGVCTGSLCGVSILSYVEDNIGWSIGFGIPTVAMILSIVFFSGGTKFYTYKDDDRNVKSCSKSGIKVTELIRSIADKILRKGGRGSVSADREAAELELEERPLCSKAYDEATDLKAGPCTDTHKMDNVRAIIRLIPIWTMLLTFAVIFQQPATFFTKQGMTMRRDIGPNFKIPPATLQSAITISIIVLMPFYDKILVPITQMITQNKKGITVFQRIGSGMVLSIIAMIIAALVESKRLHIITQLGLGPHETVPLSIFWLLPQYILLGISDIFTVVGMQEFFYAEVPIRMKTMGIALYTSVFGVGSFVSALLITLVEMFTKTEGGHGGWFADDMRKARLDKYYWLLTVLSLVSLVVYVLLCRCFKSRESLETQTESPK